MRRHGKTFAIVGTDEDGRVRYVESLVRWGMGAIFDPAGEAFPGGKLWPAKLRYTFESYAAALSHVRSCNCAVRARGFYIVRIA